MNLNSTLLIKRIGKLFVNYSAASLLALGACLTGRSDETVYSGNQTATAHIYSSDNDRVIFKDTSSSGTVNIVAYYGGVVRFEGSSQAGTSYIRNEAMGYGVGGTTTFTDNASAGSAWINNSNSTLTFSGNASLGNGIINSRNDSSWPNDPPATVLFTENATAGYGNISNYYGATLSFTGSSSATNATISNTSDSLLDISGLAADGITIGKLNNSGTINLGTKTLTIGTVPLPNYEILGIGGTIMGTGNLIKTGTGTMDLYGNHTYTGYTSIRGAAMLSSVNTIASSTKVYLGSSSTLLLEADNILNNLNDSFDSVISLGSHTVTLHHDGNGGVYSDIEGTGSVIKTGNGEVYFSGSNTYTGGLFVNGGVVEVYNVYALGGSGNAITLNGGGILAGNLIDLDDSRAVNIGANGGTLMGDLIINHGISGDGQLTILSTDYRSANITIAGNNTFTGATLIDAQNHGGNLTVTGTLLNQGGMRIINWAHLHVKDQGQVSGNIDIEKGAVTYYDTTKATGTLTTGTGGMGDVYGNITSPSAFLEFWDSSSAGDATINIKSDGGLEFGNDATAGTATITNEGGRITFWGSSTNVAAQASITNNASAIDPYSGFLSIAYAYGAPSVAVGHLTGSGRIFLGKKTLVVGGLDDRAMSISGAISSLDEDGYYMGLPGDFKKIGDTSTLTLTGTSHAHYGATIAAGGKLALGAANIIINSHKVEITGSATLAVDADNVLNNLTGDSADATLALGNGVTATLRNTLIEDFDDNQQIVTASTGTSTYAGHITGNGTIKKTGEGTLTLTGSNSHSGGTTIAEGTLVVNSDAALGASSGALNFEGDLAASMLSLSGDVTADNRTVTVSRINTPYAHEYTVSAVIDTAGHNMTIGKGLAGDGALQLTGGGTVALGGNITHTAYTHVANATTLALSGSGGASSKIEAAGAGSTVNVLGTAYAGTIYSTTNAAINFKEGSAAAGKVIASDNSTVTFSDNASAGASILWMVESMLNFTGSSTAGSAEVRNGPGSVVRFTDNATAGNAKVENSSGGWNTSGTAIFTGNSTVGSGTVNNYNSHLIFTGSATANNGVIASFNYFDGGPASVLDISGLATSGITIGDLYNNGLIVLGGKTLTIGTLNRDMYVSGTITGAGTLVKSGSGALTLDGANTHTGGVRVAGGKLLLNSDAALGATTGTLALDGGTLVYNSAFNLASARPVTIGAAGGAIDTNSKNIIIAQGITGAGALAKKGAGTLTLNGVNTYTGATTIETGALQIGDSTHANASLKSNVTVNNGATLAGYGTVIGNITNNGTVSFGDAFEQPVLAAPFMRTAMLLAAPAPRASYTIQGNLTNNNLVKLGRTGGTAGNALTVTGTYSGTGTIRMNTDFASGATDQLIVQGGASGAIKLWVNNTMPANATVADNTQIDLLKLPTASTATISLTNGTQTIDSIEIGMITFNAAMANGSFRLYSTDRQSHAADAILSTASVTGAEWHFDLDSASKRMGDLRAATSTTGAPHKGDIWIRANTYRLNAEASLAGAAFHEYVNNITAGADCTRDTGNGTLALGAFLNIGHINRSFDNHGNGSTGSIGIGAYGTWLFNGGWYLDAVAKIDRNTNDFDARAVDGHVTSGKYTTSNQTLSAEFGRQMKNSQGWWIEPSVQLAMARIGGNGYTTTGATELDVEIESGISAQYRFQVRGGKYLAAGRWNPYVKLAAAKNESNDGNVSVWGKNYTLSADSWRTEAGVGVSYLLTPTSQVYLDYEYAKAANYERPYSLNLGYRCGW